MNQVKELTSIFNIVYQPVIMIDQDYRIIFRNKYSDILTTTSGEIEQLSGLIGYINFKTLSGIIDEVFKTGKQSKPVSLRFHTNSSLHLTIDFSIYPWDASTGQTHYVLLMGKEATGQKPDQNITREDMKLAELELFEQSVFFLNEGIGMTDAQGRFIYTNPAFDKMFEYEPGELIGKTGDILNAAEDDEALEYYKTIVKDMNETGMWQGEGVNKTKTGKIIHTLARLAAFEHPFYGKIWIGMQSDISERKQFERKLQIERDAAQEANEAKSRFLAVMSHELRTPLNAILGAVQLFNIEGLDAGQNDKLKLIQTAGDHLLNLINDILTMGKIEQGKYQVSYVKIDIIKEIQNITDIFIYSNKKSNIEIKAVIDKNIPHHIVSDPVAIRQVLYNLLSNASKFTDRGSITVTVKWQDFEKEILELAVVDTGKGISKQNRDKIFNMFEQEDFSKKRKHEGTGIGLAISKELAALLDGSLNLDSEEGRGSTFALHIPVQMCRNYKTERPGTHTCSLCENKTEAIQKTLAGHIESFETLKVLIIEDNAINIVILKEMLHKSGISRVDIAENGAQALTKTIATHYDFIFMDIHLPDMTGYEISKQIKKPQSRFNKPYIIAVTADTIEDNLDEMIDSQILDYLIKPVAKANLVKKILKIEESTTEQLIENYT